MNPDARRICIFIGAAILKGADMVVTQMMTQERKREGTLHVKGAIPLEKNSELIARSAKLLDQVFSSEA